MPAKLARVATPHKAQVKCLLLSSQCRRTVTAKIYGTTLKFICQPLHVCVCVYCGSLCSDTPYLADIPHRASLIPSPLPSSTPAVPGTDGHASGTAIRMHAGTHTHTHSSSTFYAQHTLHSLHSAFYTRRGVSTTATTSSKLASRFVGSLV